MTEKYLPANRPLLAKFPFILFAVYCEVHVSLLSSVDFDEDACCDRTDPKQMDTAGGSVETKDGLFGGWE